MQQYCLKYLADTFANTPINRSFGRVHRAEVTPVALAMLYASTSNSRLRATCQ